MGIYPPNGSTRRSGPWQDQSTAFNRAEILASIATTVEAAGLAASAAARELGTGIAREQVTATKKRDPKLVENEPAPRSTRSGQTQPIPISRPSRTQPTSNGAPWTLAGGGTRHSWLGEDGKKLAGTDEHDQPHW